MTLQDWLNLIGSLGLISAGSLVGSLITIFIKYLLDRGKLKTERQSSLQKEIYFELQKQAEKIFKELNLMNRQVEEMSLWLKEKIYTPNITKKPVENAISEMSSVQIHFPKSVLNKYNKVVFAFRDIAKIYCEAGKTGNLSEEDADKWNKVLVPDFITRLNDCISIVLEELTKNKEKII